jgi:hypothetical protein
VHICLTAPDWVGRGEGTKGRLKFELPHRNELREEGSLHADSGRQGRWGGIVCPVLVAPPVFRMVSRHLIISYSVLGSTCFTWINSIFTRSRDGVTGAQRV